MEEKLFYGAIITSDNLYEIHTLYVALYKLQ